MERRSGSCRGSSQAAEHAIEGDKPGWWTVLNKAIAEYFDPSVVLEIYGPEADVADVGRTFLASDFANPLAAAIVHELGGVTVTHAIIGGMTSGESNFVWSQDPSAGHLELDAAFASAIRTLETVLMALEGEA
jgi:hypothetical protein